MDTRRNLLQTREPSSVDLMKSTEEDSLVEGPLISADALSSAIRREFHIIPTQCHASLLSLLHVVYVILSVCVGVLCVLKFGEKEVCMKILGSVQGDSVIIFGKLCLWVLVVLFTAYMKHHHNRARSRGYLLFYRNMQEIKHLPLITHSAGNAVLLLLQAIDMSPTVQIYMMLTVLVLECLVAVSCLIYYTVKVRQFNTERAAPDVSQGDVSHHYSITHSPTETGFRGSSSLEEVVEKQADLIEYLKQHNTVLSKRLLNLTAQH